MVSTIKRAGMADTPAKTSIGPKSASEPTSIPLLLNPASTFTW